LDVTYPVASHDVVDVVAELLSTGTKARANAELLLGDKFGPFVVLHALAEGVAVEESTNCRDNHQLNEIGRHAAVSRTRVALAVSTTVVEFSSRITLGNVHLSEVANTSDLDIFSGLDEVDTLEGSVRDGAGSTAGLGAVRNGDALHVANGARGRRCEEAEVSGRAFRSHAA
jgi:hypothetical protein